VTLRFSITSIRSASVQIRAAEFARHLLHPYSDRVSVICGNIFRFRPGHLYDLVWSAGLFDYLDDRTFRVLLEKLLRLVAPGGWLLGTFPRQIQRKHTWSLASGFCITAMLTIFGYWPRLRQQTM
jgi:SAM-dependent methyltransferase